MRLRSKYVLLLALWPLGHALGRPDCHEYSDLAPNALKRATTVEDVAIEEAAARINSNAPAVRPVPLEAGDLSLFYKSQNGLLMVGDSHGTPEITRKVAEVLANPRADWLLMEMIPSDYQGRLDTFLKEPETSASFQEAKTELMAHLDRGWNHRNSPEVGEQNIYYKLLLAAKATGKPVYAADACEPWLNGAFGFIGMFMTLAPRNVLWASRIPKSGNGIVFGGDGHFNMDWNGSFQDFAHARGRTSLFHLSPPK